jgi:hypothetical protein
MMPMTVEPVSVTVFCVMRVLVRELPMPTMPDPLTMQSCTVVPWAAARPLDELNRMPVLRALATTTPLTVLEPLSVTRRPSSPEPSIAMYSIRTLGMPLMDTVGCACRRSRLTLLGVAPGASTTSRVLLVVSSSHSPGASSIQRLPSKK